MKFNKLWLIVVMFAVMAVPAFADTTLYWNNATSGTNHAVGYSTSADHKTAQTFIVPSTGDSAASHGEIYINKGGTPTWDLNISIWTDGGTGPGSKVASTQIFQSGINVSTRNYYAFDTPPALVAGDTYWFVIERSDGLTSTSTYWWIFAGANQYSDGTSYQLASGNWVQDGSLRDVNGYLTFTAGTPADTSFNITAADAETAAPINTFNVTLNATKLTTTNGTITYNVTGEYTTLVEAEGYIPVTTTYTYDAGTTVQWNLTKILRNVTFQAYNNFSGLLNDFNLSIDGTPYTTGTGTIIAPLDRRQLHNLTFTKAGYYPLFVANFNATNNYNATLTNVLSNVTFTAVDDESTPLSNFNVTIDAVTTNIPGSSGPILLDTSELYNITFSKDGYLNDELLNHNVSTGVQGNLTSYFQITVGAAGTPGVPGSTIYFNNRTSGPYSGAIGYSNTADSQFAQGFVSPSTVLSNGTIYLQKSNNPTHGLNFSVYTNVSNVPHTLLGTANIAVGDINGSQNNTFHFPTPVTLVEGNSYFLVIRRDDGTFSSSNYYSLTFGFNQYLPGEKWVNNNVTGTWTPEGSGRDILMSLSFGSAAGAGGNLTGDYRVLFNGSNYYPNAENITFLPVRNTVENFSVYPNNAFYKSVSYVNYDTTNHLNVELNESHRVTATNKYDSSNLANFTVSTPVQNYTAIGTTAYLQNDTGIINYTVSLTDYFDVTNSNVDVTNGSSSVEMHQAELYFNASQRFTGNAVTVGNVTIGATTKALGQPFYLNAGTYSAQFTSAFTEAVPQNFTVTALSNGTQTITNVTNANLTITGRNAIDGSVIPFFSTTVVNNTLFINLSKTEASPHLYNLIQNTTLNVTFDNSTYALNNTFITLTNRSSSYEFLVYTTNSFNISILDEQNQSEIVDTNFTVEFIGSYQSYNTTYTEGNLYVDLIVPDTYQIRYKYINDTGAVDYGMLRQYYYTLTNRTYNPIDVYALQNSESNEITVTVQNADTLQREEGVVVLLQRFYIDSNSYETVAMYQTDSQGRAYFDVEFDNELYRFSLQSPFGTTVRTTEPAYLHETSYIIYTTDTVTNIETAIELGDIDASFDWDNTTQTLTVTYTDPASLYSQYQLNLYEKGTYTNTLVNTSTSTTSTGSLVVGYAFRNDTQYIGTMSVSNSPAIEIARFSITDFIETQPLPNLSLFLVSILFTIMVFVSAFSLYSVVIGAVALVAAQVMGLLTFSTPVVGMILFGAIFLAVILEWRRG